MNDPLNFLIISKEAKNSRGWKIPTKKYMARPAIRAASVILFPSSWFTVVQQRCFNRPLSTIPFQSAFFARPAFTFPILLILPLPSRLLTTLSSMCSAALPLAFGPSASKSIPRRNLDYLLILLPNWKKLGMDRMPLNISLLISVIFVDILEVIFTLFRKLVTI